MKTIIVIENQGTHVIEDEHKLTARQAMKEIGLDWKQYTVTKTAETKTRITYTLAVKPQGSEPQPVNDPQSGESPDIETLDSVDEPPKVTAESSPNIHVLRTTIYRKEFEEALKTALDVIPRKTSLPILTCVKLAATNEALAVTATDLEVTWTRRLIAEGDPVTICVPLALLYKEVKALPPEITNVVLCIEENRVRVNDRCAINLSDPAEYPEIEEINPVCEISIPDLSPKVKKVFPAVSTDETRYILNCVYFDFRSGMIVATDGFRLHAEAMEIKDIDPVMLPRSAANLLVKHPGSGTMRISDTRVSFDLAGGELSVKPMEGSYPDWKGIVEGFHGDEKIEFSAEQFLKVLEGVIPVTDSNKAVVLSANGDLTIEALGEAGEYSWHIPCYVTGIPSVLTFNLQFLSDAIKAFAGDGLVTVRCQRNEYGPVLINDNAIVMPVRR